MLVYIYNSQMSMLGVVEEITSLIWTRRYWDVGDFKLLVPFNAVHNQLLQTGNIIIRHGDTEAAEIQYVSISKNLEGYEIIEAQGKFLSHWLSKRLVTKQIVNTVATNQELIRRMVDDNCINADAMRVIPNLSLHDDDPIDGVDVTYTSEEYCNLLDAVIECAQSSKIGFRITTDREHGTHEFSVYKGHDYTADNAEGNPPCIFSPDYDNVLEQEYTVSTERYITTAYVQGEEKDDGSAPALAIVGEELGFVGCCIVIGLRLLIVIQCILIGLKAKDTGGRIICGGVAALIGIQSFINISVATLILPNTGLSLPFVSYGLTSVVCFFMGIGLVLNVGLQPNKYQ